MSYLFYSPGTLFFFITGAQTISIFVILRKNSEYYRDFKSNRLLEFGKTHRGVFNSTLTRLAKGSKVKLTIGVS